MIMTKAESEDSYPALACTGGSKLEAAVHWGPLKCSESSYDARPWSHDSGVLQVGGCHAPASHHVVTVIINFTFLSNRDR
jgi:hypothetical protein